MFWRGIHTVIGRKIKREPPAHGPCNAAGSLTDKATIPAATPENRNPTAHSVAKIETKRDFRVSIGYSVQANKNRGFSVSLTLGQNRCISFYACMSSPRPIHSQPEGFPDVILKIRFKWALKTPLNHFHKTLEKCLLDRPT